MNLDGNFRAKNFGTFRYTSIAYLRVESISITGIISPVLHPGIIHDNGDLKLRFSFDHRVMDGSIAAKTLNRMEEILNKEILEELNNNCPLII